MSAAMPFRAWVAVAAMVAMGPVALFAYHGVAVVVLVTGLAALLSWPETASAFKPLLRRAAVLFLPLILWASASVLWSQVPDTNPWLAFGRAAALLAAVAMAAGLSTLPAPALRRLAGLAVLGMGLYAALYAFELASGGVGTKLVYNLRPNRNDYLAKLYPAASIMAMLFWPMVVVAHSRLGLAKAMAVGLVLAGLIAVAPNSAPKLGLMLSLALFPAALLAGPRRAALALAAVVVAWVMVEPFAAQAILGPMDLSDIQGKLWHRTHIWRFAAEHVMEHPVLGWGLEASRAIPGGSENIHGATSAEQLPLHPHNFVLQVWLELGGVGAALLAGAIAGMLWCVGRWRDRVDGAMALATFATWMGIHLVSHGLWQQWWLSTAALAVGLVTLARSARNAAAAH